MSAAPSALGEADVLRFLKTHPDFLNRHPELFGALSPPKRAHGDGVIDLQHAMLERLRGEVTQLKDTQRSLIQTTRGNMNSTSRVHACVLALLESPSFEHLIHVVTQDMAQILDVDVVALCVEAVEGDVGPAPPRGVRILDPGEVDHLVGKGRDVALVDNALGDAGVFGGGASLVRSAGYARLKISPRTPPGMLALGSRLPDTFNPTQATELLGFLAGVLALSIRSWLDLPE
ncbi:MAG: DUF484 family protein [Alphaproteobacteria bacterium]|nr:DUF484 family protein [Alphaproteobacteria bacterium]